MQQAVAQFMEYVGPGKLVERKVELPECGPADMLVAVSLCGVDGSEVHMFRGELQWINDLAPLIFGDEIIGQIVKIGDEARRARGLSEGDRVAIEAKWPCNECGPCEASQYYLCDRYGLQSGYSATSSANPPYLWGGYATHIFVPEQALVYSVPDELSDEAALIACSPLANGERWVTEADVNANDHVVIIGPGPQGLCCALAAIAKGARVSLVGLSSDTSRLELGSELGATSIFAIEPGELPDVTAVRIVNEQGKADVVIDLAGVPSAKQLGFAVLAKLGTFVNVALSTPAKQPIDWVDLLAREIRLLSFASHPQYVEQGFKLAMALKSKGIDIGSWITDIYPLAEAETALSAAAYELPKKPIKVALDPRL